MKTPKIRRYIWPPITSFILLALVKAVGGDDTGTDPFVRSFS